MSPIAGPARMSAIELPSCYIAAPGADLSCLGAGRAVGAAAGAAVGTTAVATPPATGSDLP